jgi:glycosyltransferase involved in cell wall biosynthesis
MDEKHLTVAICSNNFDNLISISLPFLSKIAFACSVVIMVDSSVGSPPVNFLTNTSLKNIEIYYGKGSGLSVLRNAALAICKTKYILFIDDDVTFECNRILEITAALNSGFTAVGLRLILPSGFNKWYLTSNQHHYIGIHTISTAACVWGACMAFNLTDIRAIGLLFDEALGRQNNKLLSGEDTTFVKTLEAHNFRSTILNSSAAIHHVDKNKLKFKRLANRVFWQGVTEVKRSQISLAIKKEVKRNFSDISIANLFIGLFWMQIFISGIVYCLISDVTNRNLQ